MVQLKMIICTWYIYAVGHGMSQISNFKKIIPIHSNRYTVYTGDVPSVSEFDSK